MVWEQSTSVLLNVARRWPSNICWETLLSSLNDLGTLTKNHNHRNMSLFLDSQFLFHWFICLSFDSILWLDFYCIPVNFEIGKCESSSFVLFFFKTCFGYSEDHAITNGFQNEFVNFYNETSWGSDRHHFEFVDQLEGYHHLNSIKSFSPWTWNAFPILQIFFHSWFTVFRVYILNLFC